MPITIVNPDNYTATTTTATGTQDQEDMFKEFEQTETRSIKRIKKSKVIDLNAEIELEIEKVPKGLRIRVKSLILGAMIDKFKKKIEKEESGGAKYQNEVYYALTFSDNFNKNALFNKYNTPNLEILRYFDEFEEVIIKNVFSNKEIRKYILSFQEFIKKLKDKIK